MRLQKCLWAIACLAVPVFANTVLDLGFTTGEGFTNGPVNNIGGMNAQGGWLASDSSSDGYMYCASSYNRARNYANYTLDVGDSVVIETTLRLQGDRSQFTSTDLFRIGFAENAQHSGANTPSIGSNVSSLSDGGFTIGLGGVGEFVTIPSSSSNDWIKITQIITRSTLSNLFTGSVSAYNVTTDTDLGSTSSEWTMSTDDGSWGGAMRPSFRAWNLPFPVELQVDHWTVYTQAAPEPPLETEPIHILIDPEVSVAIGGHLELDRQQFFSLSDAGKKFESKINNDTQEAYYVEDLGMNFGRELGGTYGTTGWSSAVREDPGNPGRVDIAYLTNNLTANNGGSSAWMMDSFSPNLDIAQHDRYGNVPSFMESWYADGDNTSHTHAVDTNNYSDYVAAVLEYSYTDWTRPATYEIVNEPNWRVTPDQRFADIHMAVKQKVDAAGLNVDVGGPCIPVGYFYKNNYQSFSGLDQFMANTGFGLDFYSFHIYDYMHFDTNKNDFAGRVSTGLPIEGVLDMVQNYTMNTYGSSVDMVLSEHGGYISTDQEGALDLIAETYFPSSSFPGTQFEWEMKRRSVSEHLAVSSAIANTMAFMNNPHVVRKAVPFILLESADWNPRYYSTLLVKENFDKNSSVWHESTYVNFFKFFQNVEGRRIRIINEDPDIQSMAYVNGSKLYVLLNNMASKPENLALNLPTSGIQNITLRRFGRNDDFTPSFSETTIQSLDGLQIASREAMAIEIDYASVLQEKMRLDEVPYYGDIVRQEFTGTQTFNVAVPDFEQARSAMLRISVGWGAKTDHGIGVVFNGTTLDVPLEDCAERLDNGSDYGGIKLIPIPPALLQANNSVQVTLNEGQGGVGSVVIRAALEEQVAEQVYAINVGSTNDHVASDGTVYIADAHYNGGSTYRNGAVTEFVGTNEDPIYEYERFAANLGYSIPVDSGTYEVTLHFAENYFETTGSRIFDVAVEGSTVITSLDIVSEVGGRGIVYDRTFSTTVNDGALNIDLSAVSNNAKINAIKAVRHGSTSSAVYSDWVLQMGLSPSNAVATADDDGDGYDTYSEFIADTDPLDANSHFMIEGAGADGMGFGISFSSSTNRLYSVKTTDDLTAGWTVFTNGISGSGNMIDIIDPTLGSNLFYRIEVELD